MLARPPSLLISSSSLARPLPSPSNHHHSPSNSPFRYVHLQEKPPLDHPLSAASFDHPLSGPSRNTLASLSPVPRSQGPLQAPRTPSRSAPPPLPSQARGRPQGFRIPDRLKPWLGIGSWAVTSIGFLLAIAFWKHQVFTGLDQLSIYLESLGNAGYAVLFCLIFLTTIPPFPLYSTLIILSGYTFGPWIGAAISYSAALSGAVVVFLLSRHYLRHYMTQLLSHTVSLKRVVRAIEKRPKLLLLIRVAPYPYNLMNVLLASSHALSFRTYFACTALSLVKVLVHTSIGSGIHNFAKYDVAEESNGLARAWTATGIILCLATLVYLSYVARRAVEDELEENDETRAGRDEEEQVGFLSHEEMSEVVSS